MTEPTADPPAATNVLANDVTVLTSGIVACCVLGGGITEALLYLYWAVTN